MLARWPLRRRLVALVLVLLATVATVIGVASTLALRDSLVDQVDAALRTTLARGGREPTTAADSGQTPPALDIPGMRDGTVWVDFADLGTAQTLRSGYIADYAVQRLTLRQLEQLADVRPDAVPRTVRLDRLGDYRVVATSSATTYTVVGLPMAEVDATTARHVGTTVVVVLTGLAVVGLLGTVLVRRELRPLARVAATASVVAATPLHRGEVVLPARVAERDADAATEVGRVGAALNQLLAHVEGALTARHRSETQVRQFVADASHELRTPLASIRGYAELVRRVPDEVPDDVLRAMDRVESEARRMTSLVEDLLLLARLDAGRPLERVAVDVSALAADAVADAHAAGPDHVWRLELPEEPAVVTGDDAALRQVLANLLSNARVHTPAGTTVTTRVVVGPGASPGTGTATGTRPGTVAVTVVDDGPGIPADLRERLFDRFARADGARSPGTGTGLGLSIARAVVQAHGGTITADGTPGATTFTVTLPVAGPAPLPPADEPPAQPPPAQSPPA